MALEWALSEVFRRMSKSFRVILHDWEFWMAIFEYEQHPVSNKINYHKWETRIVNFAIYTP